MDPVGYQLIVSNEGSNMPIRIITGSWENPEKKFAAVKKKLAALSKRYPELKGLARGRTVFVNTDEPVMAHLSKNKVKDSKAQTTRWGDMLLDPDLKIRHKEQKNCQRKKVDLVKNTILKLLKMKRHTGDT